MDGAFRWLNEPPAFAVRGRELTVTTRPKSDFWNNTFYGFNHQNGHLFARPVTGDFSAEVTWSARYATLYDQVGLMVRVDEGTWLKAGTEFTDGALHLSVVVTRGDQSDWSMMPLASDPAEPVSIRATRHGEAIRIQAKTGAGWSLVRLAYLPMPATVDVGPMCCSPGDVPLSVTFHDFAIGPAISRELHTPD